MIELFVLARLLLATPAPVPTPEALAAFVEQEMPRLLEEHHIAGAVVTLLHDGQVVYAKGFGSSDCEARLPVDPERTLFRVGSISKLFVWTAVMQCVECGLIDLDASADGYERTVRHAC